MKTIIIITLLFCSCAYNKVIQDCNTWTYEQSEEFKNCLDSLGGSDTDCIDCQYKVFGCVVDTFYLL
jgi:hypothetical protein